MAVIWLAAPKEERANRRHGQSTLCIRVCRLQKTKMHRSLLLMFVVISSSATPYTVVSAIAFENSTLLLFRIDFELLSLTLRL